MQNFPQRVDRTKGFLFINDKFEIQSISGAVETPEAKEFLIAIFLYPPTLGKSIYCFVLI